MLQKWNERAQICSSVISILGLIAVLFAYLEKPHIDNAIQSEQICHLVEQSTCTNERIKILNDQLLQLSDRVGHFEQRFDHIDQKLEKHR